MVTSAHERRFYHILIRVVFSAVTAGSLIALLAEQFWVAELFTHFRLYYLMLQALLALIFLYTRHHTLLVLTVLFAVPNAWVAGPYLLPVMGSQRVTVNAASSIDIIALNVNYHNDEFALVAGYLRERDPDIIVISEYTPAWRDALRFLRESHPYQLGEVRLDPWGLAVFSRLPLMESELIDLADTDTVHARFIVVAGMMSLEVFAVHLRSPKSAVLARERNLQLESLADQLVLSKHQRIVIGDLNLTPFSPYFSRFVERSGLQDVRRVDGFHVTWPVSVLPIWIPIDHALADADVNIASVHTGPDVGSDHFPLEVSVSKKVYE